MKHEKNLQRHSQFKNDNWRFRKAPTSDGQAGPLGDRRNPTSSREMPVANQHEPPPRYGDEILGDTE